MFTTLSRHVMDCPGLILAFFLFYGIFPPAEQLRSIVELLLREECVGQDSFLMNGVMTSDESGHVGDSFFDRCVAVSVLKERRKMCFVVILSNV